jgi:hypothetical protein
MANPIAYNSGTTVNGCINTGTISLAIDNFNYSIRPGNLNWYAGADPTNRYLIVSDTYSQGVDTQANSKPTIWATSALTDSELLKWINGLPARSGLSTFGTLSDAISWLTSQNKYLISNQHYPQIVTSGMVLNLDAGFTSSYPNVGTNWYDLYSNGTGSLNNGPVWNNLGMSSNISFDRTNDYYELTNRNTSLEFQPNQPYSCLVFYKSPTSVSQTLIANMQDAGTPAYPGWDIWFNNQDYPNTVSMHLISNWSANAIKVAVDYNFSSLLNRWLCFGYTYDGSVPTNSGNTLNSVNFFLNGQLYEMGKRIGGLPSTSGDGFETSATTITYNPNQRFRVSSRWSASGWNFGSQTSVAKVLVYNRKLTASEFAQNFYQGPIVTSGLTFAIDAGNLVSYGGVGTTVYDLTTTGVTGTLTNGPTWTYLSGGTFSFDGTDDNINFSSYPVLTNNLTLSFWFRTTVTPSGYKGIVTTWTAGQPSQSSYGVQFKNDGTLEPVRPIGSNWNIVTSSTNVTNGNWYYCTVVYNTSGTFLYLNSVLNASNSTTGNMNTPLGFRIGSDINGGNNWNGSVSNVQIYNRALSESEIKQNFEAYRGRFGV